MRDLSNAPSGVSGSPSVRACQRNVTYPLLLGLDYYICIYAFADARMNAYSLIHASMCTLCPCVMCASTEAHHILVCMHRCRHAILLAFMWTCGYAYNSPFKDWHIYATVHVACDHVLVHTCGIELHMSIPMDSYMHTSMCAYACYCVGMHTRVSRHAYMTVFAHAHMHPCMCAYIHI